MKRLELTPERREGIAEALRGFMPELNEAAVQRALFAIWPPRFKGEVCAICSADLASRPILRTVHSHYTRVIRLMPVHMKPVQLVISARIEGSHGVKPDDVPEVFFRVCMTCFHQVKP